MKIRPFFRTFGHKFMPNMKIYVASSWRNAFQPRAVEGLRAAGFEVYDFRHPGAGIGGFHWSDVDPAWQDWSVAQYCEGLRHPVAEAGFGRDLGAMKGCDACLLVLPCGRSAHTEAGWFAGSGKPVAAWLPEPQEPELMYKLFDCVTGSLGEAVAYFKEYD